MAGAGISFITFTRNSARHLPHLLSSVADVVDEIIVVDGYSSDGTVEIAKSFGAKVYQRRPWGYADPDRMFALRMAGHEWVLYLDTDERLGKRLKKILRGLVEKAPRDVAAFSIQRFNTYKGRLVLAPFYPDYQFRLYRRDRVTYKGLVHEYPTVHGRVVRLPEEYYIIHFIDDSYWRKMVFYARLETLEYYRYREGRKGPLLKLAPLSAPLLYLYYTTMPLLRRLPVNKYILVDAAKPTLYDVFTVTLMKIRGKKRKLMAKLVQEKGLIQLLGL